MENTYYDRITGERDIIECEEDLLNAKYEELCDIIDGTIGLCTLTAIFCLLTLIFV